VNRNGLGDGTEQERFVDLLSSYKAEWLLEQQVFDLFTEPAYFRRLKRTTPCVLVGGRGTGKTTSLKCLSYEGQFELGKRKASALDRWPFFGMYYRVNTNRVTAFQGDEHEEPMWIRLFSHYVNLLLSLQLLEFVEWYGQHAASPVTLPGQALREVAATLQMESTTSHLAFSDDVKMALLRFEAYINDFGAGSDPPGLSAPGAPIDVLVKHLLAAPEFAGRQFVFLIDEYENLEDYQQRVLNTYVKHSGAGYSFKIGVRELGLRQHTTLRPEEQLVAPADYVRIDITDELADFSGFAEHVLEQRLRAGWGGPAAAIPSPRMLFKALTAEEEAAELGVAKPIASMGDALERAGAQAELEWFKSRTELERFTLGTLARGRGHALQEAVREAMEDEARWRSRFQNYKTSAMFSIRRGKRGFHKLYSGWDTLCRLAAGNIRYLLELVNGAMTLHLQDGLEPSQPVSPWAQTRAAIQTGRMHLRELEGLTVRGAQLTKLLLSLGRVFQVMASYNEGHTPEVNQFHLAPAPTSNVSGEDQVAVEQILDDAVMHLALLRFPGSKLQDSRDTRDYDYSIHPIFAPYFCYSHRKKRKISLTPSDILALIRTPPVGIKRILERQGRPVDSSLPSELGLFEGFYESAAE